MRYSIFFFVIINSFSLAQNISLLPIQSPATQALVRFAEIGIIPEFPIEHLPISRNQALKYFIQVSQNNKLPQNILEQSNYYIKELEADYKNENVEALITNGLNTSLLKDITGNKNISIYSNYDSINTISFNPILDSDFRRDLKKKVNAGILQGGAVLRGSLYNILGFSSRITNGTILGDSDFAKTDKVLSQSGKFGVLGFGRDIDFSLAHLRTEYKNLFLEIAREQMALGLGLNNSLLLNSGMPSDIDFMRLGACFNNFTFTHIHAQLLNDSALHSAGSNVEFGTKYLVGHLASLNVFNNLRISLGESVVYGGRPIDLSYFNPFLFLKSQEHYLRDRDNANMYASISYLPTMGLRFNFEYLLDDLKFSQIGKGFWGNKSAWRVGLKSTPFLEYNLDLGLNYTRLEPYIFTHFNMRNTYSHTGNLLAAGGLLPNSQAIDLDLKYYFSPNLYLAFNLQLIEHGANITEGDTVKKNVGGSPFVQHAYTDPITAYFLDGNLETIHKATLLLHYEILRNVYFRLNYSLQQNSFDSRENYFRIYAGLRVGEF